MSNIRTQFFHKGIMLGVCLLGILISTLFSGSDSEKIKDSLVVEHRIEQPTVEADNQTDMVAANTDSLFGVDGPETSAD